MFKIFQKTTPTELEEEMNKWLRDNPNTKVLLMSQSESWESSNRQWSLTVTVYYKKS